jgi:hypothetical protein
MCCLVVRNLSQLLDGDVWAVETDVHEVLALELREALVVEFSLEVLERLGELCSDVNPGSHKKLKRARTKDLNVHVACRPNCLAVSAGQGQNQGGASQGGERDHSGVTHS